MFNPLLDAPVYVRTWYDIAEGLQTRISSVSKKGRGHEATYHLNVLDLIDEEAAAYWRDYGMALSAGVYSGSPPVRRIHAGVQPEPRILVSASWGTEGDEISLI